MGNQSGGFTQRGAGIISVDELGEGGEVTESGLIYKAILSQSGTAAPTVTVLENTLGVTPVWTRIDVGYYGFSITDIFLDKNVFLMLGTQGSFLRELVLIQDGLNGVAILTTRLEIGGFGELASEFTDGLLSNTSIEINIYPVTA